MKKSCFLLFIWILSLSVRAQHDLIPVEGYSLVWSDEFSAGKLEESKWNYRGLGRRGDAYNSKDAVSLNKKGQLVIEATAKGDSVFTGMISTEGIFESKYGYFECRAKLTKTFGIWPAFWLQSSRNGDYGTPEENGVEIDIFEYFLNEGRDSVSHALHWGGYKSTHKVLGPVKGALKKRIEGFHTFGLEWTPNYYAAYVDGACTHIYKGPAISKVKQFIILSLHVDKRMAGPLNPHHLPDSLIVDYVRVYKKKTGTKVTGNK